MRDARAAGYDTRETYAAARRHELATALALANVTPAQLHGLGFIDQRVSFHLPELVQALLDVLRHALPEAILTHAYEGGHPDHDATAFAVHCACAQLSNEEASRPVVLEMTSYHNQGGNMATGHFLFHPELPVKTVNLSPKDRERKRKMFDCFATQQNVLTWFPIGQECFRPAPVYDFTQPPHPGTLYYELFDWGMAGALWRRLASRYLLERGHPCPPS